MVVSKIFYVHPYLGKIPSLTKIFQMGLKPPTSPLCPQCWRICFPRRVTKVVPKAMTIGRVPNNAQQRIRKKRVLDWKQIGRSYPRWNLRLFEGMLLIATFVPLLRDFQGMDDDDDAWVLFISGASFSPCPSWRVRDHGSSQVSCSRVVAKKITLQ